MVVLNYVLGVLLVFGFMSSSGNARRASKYSYVDQQLSDFDGPESEATIFSTGSIVTWFYPPNIWTDFQEGVGWEITLTWSASRSDPPPPPSIQNVTISRDGRSGFALIFNPQQLLEEPLSINMTFSDDIVTGTCYLVNATSLAGRCTLLVEIAGEARADAYSIRVVYDTVTLTATKTVIARALWTTISQSWNDDRTQDLTCTSSGIPAPMLVWSTGRSATGDIIQAHSNSTEWNEATKLWDSRSVYRPARNSREFQIFCTPQQWQGTRLNTGTSASHNIRNDVTNGSGSMSKLGLSILILLLMVQG